MKKVDEEWFGMVTRITGLASGMDIDDIVSKLMQTERAPLDKLTQKSRRLNGSVIAIVK